MLRICKTLRYILDKLYLTGGVLAALCLVGILVIIILQMSARWFGEVFPGSTDYAGYLMAAASFFAFAHALNNGNHIRVNILLNALGRWRRWGEIWCFSVATVLSIYFAFYAVKATYWSHKLNDISQGQDATPLWIPQLAMSAGTILLAICFTDHLIRLIFQGVHGMKTDAVKPVNGQ